MDISAPENGFFSPKRYHRSDIEYVSRKLGFSLDAFDPTLYPQRTAHYHQILILTLCGFKVWGHDTENFIYQEIRSMALSNLKPKLIFWRCVDLMIREKIQIPGYNRIAVGSPREFLHAEKEEQEIAESCNRLIKNSIICWNYLYLSQKLATAENDNNRQILLKAISTHSPMSWAHINLLGEYDFSDEKLKDSFGIKSPQMAA